MTIQVTRTDIAIRDAGYFESGNTNLEDNLGTSVVKIINEIVEQLLYFISSETLYDTFLTPSLIIYMYISKKFNQFWINRY